jgi:hypothetical protein
MVKALTVSDYISILGEDLCSMSRARLRLDAALPMDADVKC